jgi:hypothetical protein
MNTDVREIMQCEMRNSLHNLQIVLTNNCGTRLHVSVTDNHHQNWCKNGYGHNHFYTNSCM